MSEPLHIKWRPQSLDDVIGQDAAVNNLRRLFEAKRVPHTFLFTGPSGTGKTTLARIVAASLGVAPGNLFEVDAARYSGIDQMRELLSTAQYKPMVPGPVFYIIDEAHALSKASWQTLLLATEQPPAHLYWAFCTTESEKVPKTIRTRSHAYDLKPVKWDLLAEFLGIVADEEKLRVKKEFIDFAARKAAGSVRQGLVFLSLLDGIIDKDEALRLVEDAEAMAGEAIDLARMIVSGRGFTWPAARKLLAEMEDVAPETIRLTVLNYATAALLKTDSPGEAQKLLAVLDAFSKPPGAGEKHAPLLLAIGTLLF